MTTQAKAKRNPFSKEAVISAMLAKEVKKAQDLIASSATSEERRVAVAVRNVLVSFKDRVDRYLDGDPNAIID